MDGVKMKNKFGIVVNCCCLSCAFKELTRASSRRLCTKLEKEVDVPHVRVCSEWRMSGQLRMAGYGRGRVKCREYLMFLLAVREDENLAEQMGLKVERLTIEQIREKFEQEHGTIFE